MSDRSLEDTHKEVAAAVSLQSVKTEQPTDEPASAVRYPLRFGIPSLDRLFTPHGATKSKAGIELRPLDSASYQQVSLCIIGPSGTGKSILGLHLASRYWADSGKWEDEREDEREEAGRQPPPPFYPSVVYVSTDLAFERAEGTWKKFALDQPNRRHLPFNEDPDAATPNSTASAIVEGSPKREAPAIWEVKLSAFEGSEPMVGIAQYLIDTERDMPVGKVAFVDLAQATAGDDWGYVSRLVSLLPTPKPEQPLHLLVIDAVEGLEMLVGDTDAFGQLRSRRSRVAQILRAAAKKCHVVLILEEDATHQHPPEEYVTDIVMRLRVAHEGDYLRRSLEVVKSRGQMLIRGEHNYVIRSGREPLGDELAKPFDFPDDPPVVFSYCQLIRSLHSLSRMVMWEKGRDNRDRTKPEELALIATPKFGHILPAVKIGGHNRGLIRGKTTSLIGDEATNKSKLGRAFLAGAFDPIFHAAPQATEAAALAEEAAVLVTTFDLQREELEERLALHWPDQENPSVAATEIVAAKAAMSQGFIYRQLEAHHLNSSLLFHIIRRCVEHALERLAKTPEEKQAERNRLWWQHSKLGPRVRLVIDDWSVIEAMYPAVAADSLFLPFLIRYFESVGITALIVATQPGRPEEILSGTSEQMLRALAHYHLYTWHVPFYGEDRVAIAAVPPMDGGHAVVGELRRPTPQNVPCEKTRSEKICGERLWIDPHFELYMGLERKEPQPVPLEVYLFSAASGFDKYAAMMNGLLNRLFTAKHGENVIVPQDRDNYASLRDFCSLHGGTHRDHTLVFQVDEYWQETKVIETDESPYLEQRTYYKKGNRAAETSDPYGLYQPPRHYGLDEHKVTQTPAHEVQPPAIVVEPKHEMQEIPAKKHDFFEPLGYAAPGTDWWQGRKEVPYLWDFGFLLLRSRAWQGAMEDLEKDDKAGVIRQVWDSLTKPDNYAKPVSWRDFFVACRKVAHWHERPHREPFSAFDLDLISPQSFACLVFEIWSSELKLMSSGENRAFPKFRYAADKNGDWGLDEMLGQNPPDQLPFRLALFRAWALIASVIDPKSVINDQHRLQSRPAPHNCVAVRHWYSTGSLVWQEVGGDNPVIHARLPGTASTRGDWFLMVGRESRSRRLGERAIDLLSRRRTHIDRLEAGLGLPQRKLLKESWLKGPPDERYSEVVTAMADFRDDGRRHMVRYSDFLKLGSQSNTDPLQWLWRSRLRDYHRHDRAWEHWLGRLVTESVKHMRQVREKLNVSPFDIYDLLFNVRAPENDEVMIKPDGLPPGNLTPGSSITTEEINLIEPINAAWDKFNKRCDYLVSELTQQGARPTKPV